MTQAFGTGTLSSSDGQRFPVRGKSLTARHLSRYFARGQGISTYTHVSDQHSTFDTKVIAATAPESPRVLDGILGNQTDLQVTEHATDTHGATLANFALFDLVGLQLSPRIRDLGKITLHRTGPRADFAARYPSAGHLLTRRLNGEMITGMWDDLLRVAASVKGGHASAALVVGKICSSSRQQNALASAIKEYGALRRTVYAARYLADETYQRRIGRQLNKGENVHALKRSLAYAGEGALRRRHHEEQAEQMWCLTLATNTVITWTTAWPSPRCAVPGGTSTTRCWPTSDPPTIASASAATVIPTRASDSGTVRGASIRSAPGRSPATSNSIRRAMSLMISSSR